MVKKRTVDQGGKKWCLLLGQNTKGPRGCAGGWGALHNQRFEDSSCSRGSDPWGTMPSDIHLPSFASYCMLSNRGDKCRANSIWLNCFLVPRWYSMQKCLYNLFGMAAFTLAKTGREAIPTRHCVTWWSHLPTVGIYTIWLPHNARRTKTIIEWLTRCAALSRAKTTAETVVVYLWKCTHIQKVLPCGKRVPIVNTCPSAGMGRCPCVQIAR